MRDPTNEPSREPIRKPTKQLGQDVLLPVNLSSKDREGEVHSEAVPMNVESPHNATRVNVESPHDATRVKRVTFSDEQDDEIHSESPVTSNSRSNDSNGLQRSAKRAVLSRQEVFFHSRISFNQIKRSSKHACLVLFSSFCATGAALKGGVHSHQVFAISSSQRVKGIESTQPRGLQHDKKSERVMFCDQEQRAKCLNSQESSCAF